MNRVLVKKVVEVILNISVHFLSLFPNRVFYVGKVSVGFFFCLIFLPFFFCLLVCFS